jgi:hypothetical protein
MCTFDSHATGLVSCNVSFSLCIYTSRHRCERAALAQTFILQRALQQPLGSQADGYRTSQPFEMPWDWTHVPVSDQSLSIYIIRINQNLSQTAPWTGGCNEHQRSIKKMSQANPGNHPASKQTLSSTKGICQVFPAVFCVKGFFEWLLIP